MTDITIRTSGRVGRITLNRPHALNALTWGMIDTLSRALPDLAADDTITMLVIDAEGDRAFCAGGDIAELYHALTVNDYDTPRRFWREEYALNKALFEFPKPVASFLQGYTMGGGVGLGCHASHRIVCENSTLSMPECAIGFVPDVGGSLLLARAPGRLGEYLGTTGARMSAADAILAGFADYFIPQHSWPDLIASLEDTGDWALIDAAAQPAPDSPLAAQLTDINAHFGGETLRDILNSLDHTPDDWSKSARAKLNRNAPLAVAATVDLIHRVRALDRITDALSLEYRFAHRAAAQGDLREGIRAAIIDKDKSPNWQHPSPDAPSSAEVSAMLMPLGPDELILEDPS